MVRGDTFAFDLRLNDVEPESVKAIYFTAKKKQTLPDSDAIFQKTIGDGITQDEEDIQLWHVRVAPEDTTNVASGGYYYDIQVNIEDDVYTLFGGKIDIQQDTTARRE